MITKLQFLQGVSVLRNAFSNVTTKQMESWFPYFEQWEPEIFRQTFTQAPLEIDFLSVKALYDLADKISAERENLALRTVSVADVGVDRYWGEVARLMEGWSYPADRSAVNNYHRDDPLRKMLEGKQHELDAALEDDTRELGVGGRR